jgi:hypothetical protein
MKKSIIPFALCISVLSSVAFAQTIPGTTVTRSAADVGCDAAYSAAHASTGTSADLVKQREECLAAAGDYDVISWAREDKPDLRFEQQVVEYYEAACLYQTAEADHGLGDDEAGLAYAKMALAVYDKVHMQYWAKMNKVRGALSVDTRKVDIDNEPADVQAKLDASLSAKELSLNLEFVDVQKHVYALYPELDPDAPIVPKPDPSTSPTTPT